MTIKHSFHRGVISLLVLSLAGAVLMLSGTGAAAANPKISDKCGALSGNLGTGQGTIAKCASNLDKGVADATEKGGSGSVAISGSTATITWNPPYEGSTAANPAKTVVNFSFSPPNPDESETKTCPPGTTEEDITGIITFDTTDPAGPEKNDVDGRVAGEVCANTASGAIKLEPGSKFVFYDPPGG